MPVSNSAEADQQLVPATFLRSIKTRLELKAKAREEDRSQSDLVRWLVERYLHF